MADEKKKKTKRPTAIKRNIRNTKRCLINKSFKSRVRTTVKRFEESLSQQSGDLVKEQLSEVYSMMDKGVKRGIFELKKASRVKRRLSSRVAAKLA